LATGRASGTRKLERAACSLAHEPSGLLAGAANRVEDLKTAFAPRGKLQLAGVIKRDLWEIGYKKAPPPPPKVPAPAQVPSTKKTMWFGAGAAIGLLLVGLGLARARRAQSRRSEAG
jgi:hypothetical protein